MIIGNGLIAKAFSRHYAADPFVTIFAKGVSNSGEADVSAFLRERVLLLDVMESAPGKLVYFSSCAVADVEDAPSAYLQHKLEMERLVLASGGNTVFRLPQVVGKSGNATNLANHLYHHIASGKSFLVWSGAERNLIDVEDVASIASTLVDAGIGAGETIPIAAVKSIRMPALVSIFEDILGRKAVYELVDAGRPFPISAELAWKTAADLNIGLDQGDAYARAMLGKYYALR